VPCYFQLWFVLSLIVLNQPFGIVINNNIVLNNTHNV